MTLSRCLDAFGSPSFFLKVPDFILMALFSLGVAFDHYLNLDVPSIAGVSDGVFDPERRFSQVNCSAGVPLPA